MKNILLLFSISLLYSFTLHSQAIDKIGLPGPMVFGDTSFNLAWAENPRDNYFVQEYVPDGETVERFKQMLTMNVFIVDMSVEDAVKQKMLELEERKKADPTCKYKVMNSPDGKEIMIDFILGESKDNVMTIMEFNIYRYWKIELGKKEGERHLCICLFKEKLWG